MSQSNEKKHPVYDVARVTPLEKAAGLSRKNGCTVLLKREDLQPVHSFKIRGAYNKIQSLSEEEKGRGVIAASAGNHAQGVALSARTLGLKALIVMPRTTPEIKVSAVKNYGADVELVGDNYSEAADYCKERIRDTGMTYIHPFDDPLVIEGQGTIASELTEERQDITHIFVPVGGGGLAAGIAQNIKKSHPNIKVIGVEPEDSNAMQVSIAKGTRVTLPHVGIFADGVAVKQVGERTFDIAGSLVNDFMSVGTDQTCAAIKSIFEDTRSIVEPAGALAVAGIESFDLPKNAVAVAICSGANMTFERLQFVAERTLLGSGKEALFSVALPEQPNALKIFCEKVVGDHSITEFNYRLHKRDEAHIFVGISMQDAADKAAIIQSMEKHGYVYADLTNDSVAKEHIRHMIGGPSEEVKNEQLYTVGFPERPGALRDFLQIIAKDNINIGLFHYRNQGGDVGRVLIGFEKHRMESVANRLITSNYDASPVNSSAAATFLR